VADNAASVAGAEQDYEMLDLSIAAYQALLERTPDPAQREAVETALRALRGGDSEPNEMPGGGCRLARCEHGQK
jgi:hypothetical protein